jgi:hypothetical protein
MSGRGSVHPEVLRSLAVQLTENAYRILCIDNSLRAVAERHLGYIGLYSVKIRKLCNLNPLKPSGNYMYHLL